MGKTVKGCKSPGYDFWSRRNNGNYCAGSGKASKTITKRKERARNKQIEHDAKYLKDKDNIPSRFPGE